MTVSSTDRRAGPFYGNGVTTSFPFTFKVFSADDLEITYTDPDGVSSVITSGFSVTLNSDQDNDPGGSIEYPLTGPPMDSPECLVALGALPYVQGTDLTNVSRFRPQVIENALDYLVMLIQQVIELNGRQLVIPVDGPFPVDELPNFTARGLRMLAFESDGQPVVTTFTVTQVESVIAAIYSAAAGPLDALSFIQAGAGAKSRSAQDKSREWLSVLDFENASGGTPGGGVQDDLAAFNAALLAAKTNGIKVVVAPTPAVSYTLSAEPTEQDGVSLCYNPSEIAGLGRPAKGNQLASMEGVSQDNYRHAWAQYLEVPNGVQATPRRYWTIYGAVDIPAGAVIPAGDVNYDSTGMRGQARSRAVNARIWGGVFASQLDQVATTQAEIGSAYGAEFDINNNTGLDASLPGGAEVCAASFAAGGSNIALAARITAAGVGGLFQTGDLFKAGCISHSAAYHYNVGPAVAFYYFSDSILNTSPALSTKNAQYVWEGRDAASSGHVGKLKTTTTATAWVNGPGSGAGSYGTFWANHADSAVLMGMSDSGILQPSALATMQTTIATAGTLSNVAVSSGTLLFTAAGTVNNLAAGEFTGQEVTVYARTGGTLTLKHANTSGGGAALILTGGGIDAAMTDRSMITLYWDGTGVWTEKSRSLK